MRASVVIPLPYRMMRRNKMIYFWVHQLLMVMVVFGVVVRSNTRRWRHWGKKKTH